MDPEIFFILVVVAGILVFVFTAPSNKVEQLKTRYTPNGTVVQKWAGNKNSEMGAKHAESLTREAIAVRALGDVHITAQTHTIQREHELKVTPERLERSEKLVKAVDKNSKTLVKEATKQGVTPSALAMRKDREHQNKETIRLEQEKINNEIRKTKALNEHDVELDFRRKMNTLAAITRYRHLQYDAFDEVRGRLILLLKEAHEIEMSNMNVYLKADILRKMHQAIDAYQEVFDAIRGRIVEGGDRTVLREIDSIAQLTGGGGSGNSSTSLVLPPTKSRNRA